MDFQSNDIGAIGNISKGLATGLNNLVSQKLGEVSRRKLAQQFQATGYSPEVSDLLATLNQQNPDKFHQTFGEVNKRIGAGGTVQPEVKKKSTFEENSAVKRRDAFLDTESKKFNAAKNLGEKADNALSFLEEHEGDIPDNAIKRKVFEAYPNWRNENASALNSMYEDIVSDVAAYKASGGKTGKMTNMLIELSKRAKAAINQPIATQKILLKELIKVYDAAKEEWGTLQKFKEESGGDYPLDIEDRFINSHLNKSKSSNNANIIAKESKSLSDIDRYSNELPDPKKESPDAEFLSSKKDKLFFIKNGSWHSRKPTKEDLERA